MTRWPARLTGDLAGSVFGSCRRPPGTRARLASRQAMRLRRLLRYAYRFSPYYRAVFDERRLRPEDIRDAAGLARLPLLEKSAARDRLDELVSAEADPRTLLRRQSSGSSGIPFIFPETVLERFLSNLQWARCYMECGGSPWRRQAKIVSPMQIPARRRASERLGLFRRDYLDATIPPDAKIEFLRKRKPDLLVTWGSTLDEIARRLEERDSRLDIPRVCSTASALWPEVRRLAGERLRARVFDLYGAVETGPIAWECGRHAGYHVRSDQVVVEIVDDEGRPARRGRVVCTVLWRRALPLIRYAIGDLAEWSDGPEGGCDQPYPVIRALVGRETDTIRLPGGSRVSSFVLRQILFEDPAPGRTQLMLRPGIAKYQMIQESPAVFRLRIVPGPEFTPEVERAVCRKFDSQFAGSLRLRVVRVERIEMPPGVKFSPLVSLEHIERLKGRGIDTDGLTREP